MSWVARQKPRKCAAVRPSRAYITSPRVWTLCANLGADNEDMVPFEKYAKAAEGLGKPSSAARALSGGAEHIERVDCLVRRIAGQQGLQSDTLDEIVTLVADDESLSALTPSAPSTPLATPSGGGTAGRSQRRAIAIVSAHTGESPLCLGVSAAT